MEQLVASITVALALLVLVLRDVLIDHGSVVRTTFSLDGARADDVLDDDGVGSTGTPRAEEEAAA
jgi:hypothetical protein